MQIYRCPACGQTEAFDITCHATTECTLLQDDLGAAGVELDQPEYAADWEYNETSSARCTRVECGYAGTLGDFTTTVSDDWQPGENCTSSSLNNRTDS